MSFLQLLRFSFILLNEFVEKSFQKAVKNIKIDLKYILISSKSGFIFTPVIPKTLIKAFFIVFHLGQTFSSGLYLCRSTY